MNKIFIIKFQMKRIQFLLFSFIYFTGVYAQQPSSTSLKELLQLAEINYPLLKSKALDVQAAQKGIDISKSTIIPSLDASYQVNYATYNNITGMAYPQFLVPISGPPSSTNNMRGVFGSATSLLLNWQPVTFGQRQSQVDFARAGLQYVTSDAANEIFKHKINVINAYLDVLTAIEFVKVYEENVRRMEASLSQIKILVVTGMKPGVDSALLKAEVSKTKIDLLNSRKFKEQIIIVLSQLLASDNIPALTDTSYFSKLPLGYIATDTVKNPLLSLYTSSIGLSNARKKVLSRTTMPTLGAWGNTYARGSGISYTGAVKATEGLGLQRFNYGLGLQLSVPILQFARIKPQLQQQDFIIKSNEEKLNEISLQLKKQNQLADTTLNNALAIVKETPLYYESAAFSYRALQSRYQSGLANFADLVQAQYGLIKSETENKTAFMAVWKALLYKAAVAGDLNLFLNQVN
ncbi:MAG TPA: TolC family protein [Chitinophagaceae bacterium]|nr:TolC family protein [Chitinophagaceae bacterium]